MRRLKNRALDRGRRWWTRGGDSVAALPAWASAGGSALCLLTTLLVIFEFDRTQPWLMRPLPWDVALPHVLLLSGTLGMLLLLTRTEHPQAWARPRLLLFTALLLFVVVLGDRLGDLVSPYLSVSALGTGLATIFVSPGYGLGFAVLFSVVAMLGDGLNPLAGLVALASGLALLLRVRRIRSLRDLALAGLVSGMAGAAVFFLVGLVPQLEVGVRARELWSLFWAAASGPLAAMLIVGLIPMAEYATQCTSALGLVELLNPSHPLLELMRERAPGTYHHSFNVADLAESAAQAVGADPLLAKVGGYFHDIGKINRPEFFIENQQDGVNPHDELTPSMSKMILTAHIREGIELGRRFGLKEDVLRFIPQHHGTAVIRYFYLKALREQAAREAEPEYALSPEVGRLSLSINDYRYDAEQPQSKEAAILMLSDSVEAAARTAETSAQLEDIVAQAIREKAEDGQLDQSPLTFADLATIKNTFCQTLLAMRHTRPVMRS